MAARSADGNITRFYRKKKPKKNRITMDYSLLTIVAFLLAFGLIMIYSASSYESMIQQGDSAFYFKKQLLNTGIGLIALFGVMFLDYHFVAKFALPAYVISMILVFLVRTPLGVEANGARRWIRLGPVNMQPAEVVKAAVILITAVVLVKLGKNLNTLKGFVVSMAWGGAAALIVWQVTNNLSSGLIIGLIAAVMYFVATPGYLLFAGICGAFGAVAAAAVFMVEKGALSGSFRYARILAWLHPEAYMDNESYQTIQALYSIGSGGLLGKGLGQSMQKMGNLPEAQNDMIFSILCEELGLFGALVVCLMFIFLAWRCAVIAGNAKDQLGSLIVTGVMAHISLQAILNIAVVTNVIPNTGVSLPFISYGGSSVVFLLAEVGLVLNVSRAPSSE